MNTHIQELIEQASSWVEVDTEYGTDSEYELDTAKFAELIVNKCLSIIETEAAQYAEPVWAFEIVNDIKEHFKVKQND